jgi:predicted oxidoreductase
MEKRRLGRTSLNVSRAVLGTMTFGGQTDPAAAADMVDLCEERGINFLDTANVYNQGRVEEVDASTSSTRPTSITRAVPRRSLARCCAAGASVSSWRPKPASG